MAMILLLQTNLVAAKVEKNTLEVGGFFSGFYEFSETRQFFVTGLGPSISYYFSDNWFIESGLGLQYSSSAFTGFPTSRSFTILPTAGIGYYMRLSDTLIFALPLFFNTSYYISDYSGATTSGFGPSVNYGLRPTLKFQVGENVNLGLFVSMQAMLVNLRPGTVPSLVTYGISWTYFW